MRLDDIATTMSKLTDEELRDRITEIRKRRIEAPEVAKAKEKKKKISDKEKLMKLLGGMSKADLQQYL